MSFLQRKQIRLQNYDYSAPGAYFVTVCTHDRRCILSEIRRGDPCGRPRRVYRADKMDVVWHDHKGADLDIVQVR